MFISFVVNSLKAIDDFDLKIFWTPFFHVDRFPGVEGDMTFSSFRDGCVSGVKKAGEVVMGV